MEAQTFTAQSKHGRQTYFGSFKTFQNDIYFAKMLSFAFNCLYLQQVFSRAKCGLRRSMYMNSTTDRFVSDGEVTHLDLKFDLFLLGLSELNTQLLNQLLEFSQTSSALTSTRTFNS